MPKQRQLTTERNENNPVTLSAGLSPGACGKILSKIEVKPINYPMVDSDFFFFLFSPAN